MGSHTWDSRVWSEVLLAAETERMKAAMLTSFLLLVQALPVILSHSGLRVLATLIISSVSNGHPCLFPSQQTDALSPVHQ